MREVSYVRETIKLASTTRDLPRKRMSIAAWCRQEDINIHQMYYWKRKFDQNPQLGEEKTKEWLPVSDVIGHHDPIDSAMVIRMDHLSVEIQPHVDRQLLSDVIHLLKYQ